MLPSEIRKKVLSQHREIEAMLDELHSGASELLQGRQTPERVKRAAGALRAILELHMAFEERHMAPAIQEADGFGPERVRQLEVEHKAQRAELDRLVDAIRGAAEPEAIADAVQGLIEMLKKDIEDEERHYVNEDLLRDSLIPKDTFGG